MRKDPVILSQQEGMLLQVDGSPFNWFGPDQPRCSLLGAIDDATGKVVAPLFRQHEDAQGYFLILRQMLKGHGISPGPLSRPPLDLPRQLPQTLVSLRKGG